VDVWLFGELPFFTRWCYRVFFISSGVFVFHFSGAALCLLFCEEDFDSPVGPDFAIDFADTNIDFLFPLVGDANKSSSSTCLAALS
jgi:hypothetical protein